MSKKNNGFTYDDGVDFKDLLIAKIDNLRTLIDSNDENYKQRFENVVEATKNALASADRAVLKAEVAMEKRFESVNEFRSTLSDQAAKFIIRTEFELVVNRLEQDIKNLNTARSEMVSSATYKTGHEALEAQVDDLRLSKATLEGKATQGSVYIAYLFSSIGIIMGIIGLLTK